MRLIIFISTYDGHANYLHRTSVLAIDND